jgi:Ras GTPase-activating-like protein IQGAP2/3
MPFTKQFFHQRDVQRSGKAAQFGSFKYSAQELYDKGILLSMDQYSPRQFDKLDIVISSNKMNVFQMEIYNNSIVSSALVASTELNMSDLLEAQFENRISLPLFDGTVKVHVNFLLYQINKKYVRPLTRLWWGLMCLFDRFYV